MMFIVIEMTNPEIVRKRSSYKEWKSIIEFLKTEPTIPELMRKIDELYDMKRAYRYNWVSEKSLESLELLLKDEGY